MALDVSNLGKEVFKRKSYWIQYFKKNKKQIEKMDLQILQFHQEISRKINCLECGNCCRTLGPRLLSSDIDMMSKYLKMKPATFMEQYVRTDEDGEMVFKKMPCPFLGSDNFCFIYENRPKACREYPHTDRKKFHQIYSLSVKNAETCPIVYGVLEKICGD